MRRLASIVAVLLASVALAAPSAGAAGFAGTDTLTTTSDGSPMLASAPNGYAIVAWAESAAGEAFLRVSLRPPGGSWSAPQTLGASGLGKSGLSVAVGDAGDAAIAWSEYDGVIFRSYVATRPAGASGFGAPTLLGLRTSAPAVGIAGSRVTLLNALDSVVFARDFGVGESPLAAPATTLARGCSSPSQLAVAPSGDAVASYYCGGATFALRRGGVWTPSDPIANSGGGFCRRSVFTRNESISMDGAGNPVGVMLTTRIDFDGGCVETRTYDASLVLPFAGRMTTVGGAAAARGVAFSALEAVSGAQAVATPAGIVFAWGDNPRGGDARAKVRFFAADGSGGSAPQTVGSTPSWDAVFPSLAAAADGRALLAWVQEDRAGVRSLFVAERPPGGAFGAPVPLVTGVSAADGPRSAAVGLAAGGDGMVAWAQGVRASELTIGVRGYDATAPALSGVAIPPSATAGAPASFAALATDFWGPVTLTWSFGDGATASGAAPQHAYAAPGSYAVSVVATDAAGNASAPQTGVVQVAAAPVPPPQPQPPSVVPPRLSGASVRPATFRVGRARATPRARARRGARRAAPAGTTFRFALDRAATVTIAFERKADGRRSGGRCVRPSRRLASARARRCTRFVAAGALTRDARAGANAVAFDGRVGRRALTPGRYRATLTPTAGASSVLSFRVVRAA